MIDTLQYFLPTDLTRCLYASDGGKISYYVREIKGQKHVVSALSNVAWKTTPMWTEFQIRNKFICLIFDSGNAIPGVRYYTFDPGFWIPLQVEVGWKKYFSANISSWFGTLPKDKKVKSELMQKKKPSEPPLPTMYANRHYLGKVVTVSPEDVEPTLSTDGCDLLTRHPGPYRNTLLAHESMDLGGDLGVIDTITLEYHTKGERHSYGRHPELGALGLVRFSGDENYPNPPGIFNKIDHKPCIPLPVCDRTAV